MAVSEKDRQLLSVLGENARMSTTELGRRLGLTRTTVQTRLEKLERNGVIRGYGIHLTDSYESSLIRAHVWVTLKTKALAAVVQELRTVPAIRAVHSVSGHVDLIVKIAAPSIQDLDMAIDTIGGIDGVEKTQSSIILSTRFER